MGEQQPRSKAIQIRFSENPATKDFEYIFNTLQLFSFGERCFSIFSNC